MPTECENCKGVGLVGTGAVPHDLSVGRKETCKRCGGTGKALSEAQTVPQPPEPPKDPGSSEESGEL